jgi:hypothetical protein
MFVAVKKRNKIQKIQMTVGVSFLPMSTLIIGCRLPSQQTHFEQMAKQDGGTKKGGAS